MLRRVDRYRQLSIKIILDVTLLGMIKIGQGLCCGGERFKVLNVDEVGYVTTIVVTEHLHQPLLDIDLLLLIHFRQSCTKNISHL